MSLINDYKIDFRYRSTSGTAGDIVWDLWLKCGTGAGLIGLMLLLSAGRYPTNTRIYLCIYISLLPLTCAVSRWLYNCICEFGIYFRSGTSLHSKQNIIDFYIKTLSNSHICN
jgi:hypothetical protein